jgi:hypothetical protein
MSNLDHNIKNKLEGYKSEVNPNMWAMIESGLPIAEQTTTRNFFWPVFGVVLLTSMAAGLYLYNSDDSVVSDNSSAILIEESSISESEENSFGHIVNEDQKVVNDNIVVENTTSSESIHGKMNNESSTERGNSNYSNNNISETSIENSLTSIKANNKNALVDDIPMNDQKTKPSVDTEFDIDATQNKSGSASLYQQYNSILKATKSKQESNIKIIEREMEDLHALDFEPKNLVNEYAGLNGILDGMASKRTICPTFKNVRFGIFAEAFFSNDFGLRDLSYNYLKGDGNYLDARNNTESANYSFSAGARVSFIMPNGLGAKTGFTYSQINESFKYLDETHKKTKTIIIKEYIWENNVIVDSIENKEEIEVEGALNVISQNKYKSVDLPLLLTYEWGYKNRLYYSITGGPLFNIKFAQKGKFLNPETLTPVEFTTGEGNYQAFNTNVGTSVYLAFALNYQLGNNADIFIEPNMRHNLKNVTLNSYELNQKYTVFGLGFGIKYKL